MLMPLRSELRCDRDRKDPTEAGLEGSPTPATPDLKVAALRYEISVEAKVAGREKKAARGETEKRKRFC